MVEKRNVCALIFLALAIVFGIVALATRQWSTSESSFKFNDKHDCSCYYL